VAFSKAGLKVSLAVGNLEATLFTQGKTVHPELVEGWTIEPFMLRHASTNGGCEELWTCRDFDKHHV
jgi:hypothetical protein